MATEKRLIYMDDTMDRLRAYADRKHQAGYTELANGILKAVNYIHNEIRRVDAVEVVHGRWVIEKRHTVSRNPYMDDNYHAHATCSECGFCIHSENASFGYPELKTTNYCPNCGAKMDGDGNG